MIRAFRRPLCLVANKGSEARDHLANERTFLAWARTGVGFVGLGVAADQMKRAQTPPNESSSSVSIHLPGLLCVGTGGFFLSYATWRYFAVQAALRQGQFPINRGGVLVVVGASSMATVAGLTLLLAPDELELVAARVQGGGGSMPQRKDG